MSVQRREPPASVAAFAPKRAGQEQPGQVRSVPADDAGNGIIALLHKAAESAKEDCARAMDLAHKLTRSTKSCFFCPLHLNGSGFPAGAEYFQKNTRHNKPIHEDTTQ
jgi:hypothetical protein